MDTNTVKGKHQTTKSHYAHFDALPASVRQALANSHVDYVTSDFTKFYNKYVQAGLDASRVEFIVLLWLRDLNTSMTVEHWYRMYRMLRGVDYHAPLTKSDRQSIEFEKQRRNQTNV